jgi:hypothetical protein
MTDPSQPPNAADYKDAAVLATFLGIDDSVFPEWGLTVVGYLDSEGQERFETKLWGAHSATTLIGILEVVKQDLVLGFFTEDDDTGE